MSTNKTNLRLKELMAAHDASCGYTPQHHNTHNEVKEYTKAAMYGLAATNLSAEEIAKKAVDIALATLLELEKLDYQNISEQPDEDHGK